MTTGVSGDAVTVRLTIPARAEYITLCRLALTGIGRLLAGGVHQSQCLLHGALELRITTRRHALRIQQHLDVRRHSLVLGDPLVVDRIGDGIVGAVTRFLRCARCRQRRGKSQQREKSTHR